MEKISGIIPSNARLASANTSEALPVRPSAPSFHSKTDLFGPALSWKGRDIQKASIVDEVSDTFFTKKANEVPSGFDVAPLLPEPQAFAPSAPLPLDQPLLAYEEAIYGPSGVAEESSSVSGESLDLYA